MDATQEMIALGLGNMIGSFVRSMPVTGSFTRTAVNNASGVRTPAGGIFTGMHNIDGINGAISFHVSNVLLSYFHRANCTGGSWAFDFNIFLHSKSHPGWAYYDCYVFHD